MVMSTADWGGWDDMKDSYTALENFIFQVVELWSGTQQ